MTVEKGFALCRTRAGRILPGPEAEGGPSNVRIPLACPPNSNIIGVFHTHPSGLAEPSEQDLSEARRTGLKWLCIGTERETRCHRV